MPRREPPKVVRQEVFWVPESKEVVLSSREEPYRVWTLYDVNGGPQRFGDPAVKPMLPIRPVHNYGAFLEDYMHDWNVRRRKGDVFVLNYYSRVVDHSVWILCEYVDRPRTGI